MLDVMTFLMRWLFLSNLLRDVAEIQTIPQEDQPPPHATVDPSSIPPLLWEEYWRNQCIHGILSCPPGNQRLLTIDALRVDLVQQLSHQIRDDQTILQRHRRQRIASLPSRQEDKENRTPEEDSEDDPYRDADLEILKALESSEREAAEAVSGGGAQAAQPSHLAAYFSISGQGDVNASSSEERKEPVETAAAASPERRAWAIRSTQQTRDLLPQIVAAVLKSPPATNPSLANPVQRLRQVLLDRCLQDPSWGIEMCWLLESEVGRAWKTLFEHRQQTGRRLIVVLPAEKAAVLAKIGSEKHEAFDLLQDAEQATAYGYRMDEPVADAYPAMPSEEKRLPSSLSLRRCSHFGDTMHFVDRLTQISLDLRSVPTIHRHQYLQERLQEMNRRIRRRMVTRGEISLDVDDHRGPLEWPSIGDLRQDMLKHSVHFPLVPQSGGWPSGRESELASSSTRSTESPKVVRVLNVVASESRLLSSRERCPFLVHMEVADTDMDGSDARLYVTGSRDVGSTVEEALRLLGKQGEGSQSYQIPNELLSARPSSVHHPGSASFSISTRGGDQAEQSTYPEEGAYYTDQNPYDSARQQELENLHRQMYLGHSGQTHQMVPSAQPHVSTGHELLDKIFGGPWAKTCREIREQSPFGRVEGWRLASFIMKAGEDIRREALVMQIISKLGRWFEEDIPAEHKPYMRPYTIMCVGGDAGLVECLSDAKSVDEVKKETDNFVSLREYFERAYGPPSRHQRRSSAHSRPAGAISFETAQDNFLRSLVGYSLVCYILQIKDRHNANILIDREGHIMHIDFGFVLGDTPKMAKVPIFSERAPFKLSQEFWDVLGGWNFNEGGLGVRFCKMFELAFACASSHADEIASLVEATMLALHPDARTARLMARGVRARLEMRGPPGSTQQKMFIMSLVNAALTSWGTTTYDWLQKSMNGYQ